MTPTKRCTGRCGRELPADAEHFRRAVGGRNGIGARCRECIRADERERRPRARTTAPTAPARPSCGFTRDPQARLRLIQRLAERRPRDPDAAASARRIMAAADRAVEEMHRPTFDADDVLRGLAEAAMSADVRSVGGGRALAKLLLARRSET